MNEAFASAFFWAYCALIETFSGFLSELASWCEGCACHEDSLLDADSWYHRNKDVGPCSYKGRRAPELACGHLQVCLSDLSSSALSRLLPLFDGLTEEEKSGILVDFHKAIDKAFFEVEVKTRHWQLLPWKVACVAHPEDGLARAHLRQCKDMYLSTVSRLCPLQWFLYSCPCE